MPGPWRIENLSVKTLDGKHHLNWGIRTGKGATGERIALLGQNQKANARLIAAAPDLKDELEDLCAAVISCAANHTIEGKGVDYLLRIISGYKAIAKSEGK